MALAFARIENHFFVNNGFFEKETQLLDNAHKLKDIPGFIVHGRYDVVCPIESAFDLKEVWPEADLRVIPNAGHSCMEEGIQGGVAERLWRVCIVRLINESFISI